jgi:uncharacterized protein (DUF2147 family)
MKQVICFSILFLGLYGAVGAQNKAADIVGVWVTNGKSPAKIQIYQSGDKFYGRIISIKNPLDESGKPKTDVKNPDEKLRSTPIINLILLKDFVFDGKDEWGKGHIYDPAGGKTYSAFIKLKDWNTMKVRGYIGVSLLGRTEIWTRSF